MMFCRIDALSGRNTFSREAAEKLRGDEPQFKISDEIVVNVLNSIRPRRLLRSPLPEPAQSERRRTDFEILSFATRPSILAETDREKSHRWDCGHPDISEILLHRPAPPFRAYSWVIDEQPFYAR